MNDDYLWNRTGKADEEIEELEQLLGRLRYQPRPLQIPVGVNVVHRSWAVRGLAIAATIAILLLGAGIWRSRQESRMIQAANTPKSSTPDKSLTVAPAANAVRSTVEPAPIYTATARGENRPRHASVVASKKHAPVSNQSAPEATANEVAEAKAAKQQLMLALRVVSAKLTLAQKRTQSANPANQIQNQHKIG